MNRQDVIERRIFWMHRMIADRLKADPGLLQVAQRNIARWRSQSGDKPWMREWERIIARGVGNVIAVLTEESENARRLRSSSPFAGILNETERQAFHTDAFLKTIEKQAETPDRSFERSR